MKFTVGDMVGVLWEAGAVCPFAGIWDHPLFFVVGFVVLIFLVFCVVVLLRLSSSCVVSILDCSFGFLQSVFNAFQSN
jgi:hypothetical protein